MQTLDIGLMGLGTVGSATARILKRSAASLEARLGRPIRLRRVLVRHLRRPRSLRLPAGVLTDDPDRLLDDPSISVVVELIGGIEPARTFLLKAIERGKHVVTANKALLAEGGAEIFRRAEARGVSVGFEAAVAGGIPIVRSLRISYAGDRVEAVYGIINGTSNYILSRMSEGGEDFATSLRAAQRRGYAEARPSLDVDGLDAAHKLALLILLAFRVPLRPEQIRCEGIRSVETLDLEFARDLGFRMKPVAVARRVGGRLEARVHPGLLPEEAPLAHVDGVLNAVTVVGTSLGTHVLTGLGAGGGPTATAVVADLLEAGRDVLAGGAARLAPMGFPEAALERIPLRSLSDLVSEFYLRFFVVDRPGVLARLAEVLGRNGISIAQVVQKGRADKVGDRGVPIVILTHEAREGALRRALLGIDRMPIVLRPSVDYRIVRPGSANP